MKVKISGSTLAGLSEADRKKQMMKAYKQAQDLTTEERDKVINELKAEIKGYELRNKLESSKLGEALEKGLIDQTPEVTLWLLAYQIIRKLEEVDTAGTA